MLLFKNNFLFFFLTSFFLNILSLQAIASGEIYGRVWINNQPASGIKVEVIDISSSSVIRISATPKFIKGRKAGSYRFTGIPSGKKLRIKATFMLFANNPASRDFIINKNDSKKINLSINVNAPININSIFERGDHFVKNNSLISLPDIVILYPEKGQKEWNGSVRGKVSERQPQKCYVTVYFITDSVHEQGTIKIEKDQSGWELTKTMPREEENHKIFAVVTDQYGVIYSYSKIISSVKFNNTNQSFGNKTQNDPTTLIINKIWRGKSGDDTVTLKITPDKYLEHYLMPGKKIKLIFEGIWQYYPETKTLTGHLAKITIINLVTRKKETKLKTIQWRSYKILKAGSNSLRLQDRYGKDFILREVDRFE